MTSYSDIYSVFLSKISDYSFVNLTQQELEDQIEQYLKSSIVKFRVCKKDLSNRDESLNQFNISLTDEEKEILATLMLSEYIKPKIVSSETYRQVMTDKEFRFYSQANHIEKLLELNRELKKESSKLMNDYSFSGLGDL